jgi:uncharacterized protein
LDPQEKINKKRCLIIIRKLVKEVIFLVYNHDDVKEMSDSKEYLIIKKDRPKYFKNNFPDYQHIKKQKLIIVGFDPGITVGIAILDMDGKLISLKSFKEISKAEIIKHIISYGKTLLVSTDVYPPPKSVKKLATLLNAKIYSPYRVMSVNSKIELVENYLKEKFTIIDEENYPENAHERDALAAAVKTYKNYQNKIKQIEKKIEKIDISKEDLDSIKAMVINGNSMSTAIEDIKRIKETSANELQIRESKEILNKKNKKSGQNFDNTDISKLKRKIKSQEKKIKNLSDSNEILKTRLKNYQNNIVQLENKLEKLYYEYSMDILSKKEISAKITIIKNLQEKYTEERTLREKFEENLKSIKKIRIMELSKKAVPVKIVESFTKEGIRNACEYWNLKKGDIVLLSSSKGGGSHTASLLIQLGIKAVIIKEKMSHQASKEFKKNMVPILEADYVDLEMIDEFAIIKNEILIEQIKKWDKKIENQRKEETKKKIIKIIDEYRAQRKNLTNNLSKFE